MDLRASYLAAADVAVALLGSPAVAQSWTHESDLAGMSVGALAGHLARSVLQVEWFLDGPVHNGPLTTAVHYYARLEGTTLPDSPLNTGVRTRSEETAQAGADVVAEQAHSALNRLRPRLEQEPAQRRIAVLHRPGEEMLLEQYLQTRCVELAVHVEDLALSVGAEVRAPEAAVAVAAELLFAAARQRHGDREVLHALARRERDVHDALRAV
jgi:hypothetical protein